MIAVYCDEMNRRVLLGLDALDSMESGDGLVDVTYQCACGRTGRLLSGHGRREISGHMA